MATIKETALFFLYRDLRKLKTDLGRAESKANVDPQEIGSLQAHIAVVDWLIPLAIAAKDEDEKGAAK